MGARQLLPPDLKLRVRSGLAIRPGWSNAGWAPRTRQSVAEDTSRPAVGAAGHDSLSADGAITCMKPLRSQRMIGKQGRKYVLVRPEFTPPWSDGLYRRFFRPIPSSDIEGLY